MDYVSPGGKRLASSVRLASPYRFALCFFLGWQLEMMAAEVAKEGLCCGSRELFL